MRPIRVYDADGIPCVAYIEDPCGPILEGVRRFIVGALYGVTIFVVAFIAFAIASINSWT